MEFQLHWILQTLLTYSSYSSFRTFSKCSQTTIMPNKVLKRYGNLALPRDYSQTEYVHQHIRHSCICRSNRCWARSHLLYVVCHPKRFSTAESNIRSLHFSMDALNNMKYVCWYWKNEDLKWLLDIANYLASILRCVCVKRAAITIIWSMGSQWNQCCKSGLNSIDWFVRIPFPRESPLPLILLTTE